MNFRVKPEEYNTIYDFYFETTCRKLSEYARNVLLQKPVSIIYHNQTAEDFLSAMNELKNKLDSAIKILDTNSESSKQNLLDKAEEIRVRMNQIYELWCQQ
ncbi:MAG TPA: plasmid mobilization relaxosome protein MobC [Puia sp.]